MHYGQNLPSIKVKLYPNIVVTEKKMKRMLTKEKPKIGKTSNEDLRRIGQK
jgi:hypothetical protein